jgi:hypothetical protein
VSQAFDLTPRKIGYRDHSESIRGFHFIPAAWYANQTADGQDRAVMIGMYHPEGGTSGEFAIREHGMNGSTTLRLEVFSDAWSALALFPDLLAALSELDAGPLTLADMVKERAASGTPFMEQAEAHRANRPTLESLRPLLISLGIADLTQETRPLELDDDDGAAS